MRYADRERHELPFEWPTTPFEIVLVEPVIPPNTGNIARLCAATATPLHLVEPLGFDLSEKQLRARRLRLLGCRQPHGSHELRPLPRGHPHAQRHLFTTSAKQDHAQIAYRPGAHLIFGSETHGLSNAILQQFPDQGCNIPIQLGAVRSLNLANAVSIALYTALRNRA